MGGKEGGVFGEGHPPWMDRPWKKTHQVSVIITHIHIPLTGVLTESPILTICCGKTKALKRRGRYPILSYLSTTQLFSLSFFFPLLSQGAAHIPAPKMKLPVHAEVNPHLKSLLKHGGVSRNFPKCTENVLKNLKIERKNETCIFGGCSYKAYQ